MKVAIINVTQNSLSSDSMKFPYGNSQLNNDYKIKYEIPYYKVYNENLQIAINFFLFTFEFNFFLIILKLL